MKILSFDTSTRGLSLALAEDGRILRYRNLRSAKVLSSAIMPAMVSILKSAGLDWEALDGLLVGLGPGSFTSLRVGISTAKALAFAQQIPAVGVSSLDAVAMNVKSDGMICVLNDARRGLVYACLYEKSGASLKRLTDYVLVKPQEALEILARYPLPVSGCFVIGDAVPLYRDVLKQQPSLKLIEDPKLYFPDARHLAALGLGALRQRAGRAFVAAADDLNPIYLYPDNCQVHK